MEAHKLEKDLLLSNPEQPGAAFIYKAGYFVDSDHGQGNCRVFIVRYRK